MTEIVLHAKPKAVRRMHPLAVRIMHWTNAVAMIIMIGSGWKIYNDEVLFGWLHFPEEITIGGEAQGALQWHFLGMWIFTLNLICYLVYGLVTGRFWRKLLPIWPRLIIADVRAALRFKLSHDDITKYNAVQRVLYVGIILVLIVQVHFRAGDLEAGTVPGAHRAVLRLPGSTSGALHLHGADRGIPRRSRLAGARRSEDARCDDHRWTARRRSPFAIADRYTRRQRQPQGRVTCRSARLRNRSSVRSSGSTRARWTRTAS